MRIISTDLIDDKQIITSFEGVNYPFYGIMYHPEFAFLEVKSRNPNIHLESDDRIVEVAKQLSKFFSA
jgi:anthranilate/para-aminobenzoate synthase component II